VSFTVRMISFCMLYIFIFSCIPGNNNLEGHSPLILDVMSQPDSRVAAMAKFMLYAVCLIEHIPNADRKV
jgi:hypothetical protein